MAAEVGSAFVSILPELRGFSARLKAQLAGELRTIDPVVGAAGTRAGQTFGNSMHTALSGAITRIGTLLKTGLVVGTTAAVAGLGALTAVGLKSAAALEQTEIGMTALLGSAEDAKSLLGDLRKLAANTPFEFAGLASTTRSMLAFGEAAGITRGQILPTLTTIGDLSAVLGTGQQEIDSVVRALGQMASKGKVSQEELLQISEAFRGFNPNAAVAAKLGLSTADAMDAITAGTVDAKTGISALLSGMAEFPGAAGAMAKQAQTLTGVFSTFKDTVKDALINAFTPVIPAIKDSLTEVTPVIGDAINVLAPALGEFLTKLLPLVATLIKALAPILGIFTDLAGTILTALSPSLEPLGKAFTHILTALSPLAVMLGTFGGQLITALIPAIDELVPVIDELVPPLIDLLIASLPLIPAIGQLAIAAVQLLVPLAQLVGWLTELFAQNAGFREVAAGMAVVAMALGALANVDFAGNFRESVAIIKNFGAQAITFFQELPGKIGAFLSNLPTILEGLARESFNRFAFAIGAGIGTVIKFFIDLPETIGNLVVGLWSLVTGLFTSGVENTRQGFSTGVSRILDLARSLPGQILGALSALPGQMYSIGRDIVMGAINGIRSMIGGLISTLRDGFASAVAGVKHGLGIASPSKVFASIGEDSIAGYVKGIQDSAQNAQAATLGAIGAAASSRAAAAPASRPVVDVRTDDPFLTMVLNQLREAVRTTYGGDVEFALGTSGG